MKNCLLLILLCASLVGYAQGFSITGKVADKQGVPIIGCNISVISQQDSLNMIIAISDDSGTFSVEGVTSGNYKMEISSIGYRKYSKDLFLDSSIDIGLITLEEEATSFWHFSLVPL